MLRFFVKILATFALLTCIAGCGSYGPIFNCRTGCKDPQESRDIFCECHKGGTDWTPAPGSFSPYLEFRDVANGCTIFQAERFVFNPRSKPVDVKIGYKERDGSNTGHFEYKWYTVSANAITFDTAYNLGLLYDEPDCFFRDYFLSDWTEHANGTSFLTGAQLSLKSLTERSSYSEIFQALDPETKAFVSTLRSQFEAKVHAVDQSPAKLRVSNSDEPQKIVEEVGFASRLDCSALCRVGDLRCFRNTPPDGSKIATLRDKILATRPDSRVSTPDILSIFGLATDPCARGDSRFDKNARMDNDGEVCAYPIKLESKDDRPVAAIHVGRNISGEGMSGKTGASIMFDKPFAMPYLLFSADYLQADYGGRLLEISADGDSVYFNTTAGSCVSLAVRP